MPSLPFGPFADSGTNPVWYHWFFNNSPVGEATNSLTTNATTANANLPFSVVASNQFGVSITNSPYYVKLTPFTPAPWVGPTLSSSISVLDLLAIGDHMRGTAPLTGTAALMADPNEDGVIDIKDQDLFRDAILWRTNLGTIDKAFISDDNKNGKPNMDEWAEGLLSTTADSDSDGVADTTEIAD
jgi:hypothetical protein